MFTKRVTNYFSISRLLNILTYTTAILLINRVAVFFACSQLHALNKKKDTTKYEQKYIIQLRPTRMRVMETEGCVFFERGFG